MTPATASQIAEALGVGRRTVYGWIERRPDFPEPVTRLSNAQVWDLDAVRRWHERADLSPGRRAVTR